MKHRVASIILLFSFVLISQHCKSIPKAEMDGAQAAIEQSRRVDAPKYAPEDFNAAKELFAAAEKDVTAKEYDAAKSKAIDAKAKAKTAYFNSLATFTDEQNNITKAARDDAQAANAQNLFPEKYQAAETPDKAVQEDLKKLKELSEKLKAAETPNTPDSKKTKPQEG